MGLSAGQARLLSITARKSDCEFSSMRLSHQKIALARELADLSNEYQNSLNQTKLIYDYYGTGDTSTQLSYNLLMYPSALNDYMPTLITDSMGRVALDTRYAAAARAAGIPQEGLGTLPSEDMRNKFIQGLSDNGLITEKTATTIQGLPYNQAAGFGGGTTVAIMTESGNFGKFVEALSNGNIEAFECADTKGTYSFKRKNAKDKEATSFINILNNKDVSKDTYYAKNISQLSLVDLLSNDSCNQYYLAYEGVKGEQTPVYGLALMQNFLTDGGGFIDWLYDEFSSMLDLGDGYTGSALEYAYRQTKELVFPTGSEDLHNHWLTANDAEDTDEHTDYKNANVKNYVDPISNQWCGKCSKDEKYQPDLILDSKNYVGFCSVNSGKGGGSDDGNDHATGGINLNNIAKAFLTYFADYMNGISETDRYGCQVFEVKKGRTGESHLAPDNVTFEYTWKIGSEVTSDDCALATFYDTMFNQICANGWTENDDINDNEYLQQMLQGGMMFISKEKDDNYYYQCNYATDTYIKEVSDETLIAYAESKYNTEKAKLNAKEETIDLKMKNLDTEISSLTTEYDTVKNTISKNIEKSFKRYNA